MKASIVGYSFLTRIKASLSCVNNLRHNDAYLQRLKRYDYMNKNKGNLGKDYINIYQKLLLFFHTVLNESLLEKLQRIDECEYFS